MKTFKDMAGGEWELSLNFAAVKRVKDLLGIDLLSIDKATDGQQPLMTVLETDITKMVEVVIAILRPALKVKDMADSAFEELIDGDTLTQMHDAFWDEVLAFYQSLRRNDLAKAVEKQRSLVTAAVATMTERIEAIDVTKIVGELSTNKRESWE